MIGSDVAIDFLLADVLGGGIGLFVVAEVACETSDIRRPECPSTTFLSARIAARIRRSRPGSLRMLIRACKMTV
jgi:hypothetical protein